MQLASVVQIDVDLCVAECKFIVMLLKDSYRLTESPPNLYTA